MSIICLDTQIIQWGVIKRAHHSSKQDMVSKASSFITWLEKQKNEIIIPSIVVGELLVPVDSGEHAEMLARLSSKWMIVDYDIHAARIFAEMRNSTSIKEIWGDIKRGDPHATRKHLTADVMIIATARANNAKKLYSHDNGCVRLAQAVMEAENFQDAPFPIIML